MIFAVGDITVFRGRGINSMNKLEYDRNQRKDVKAAINARLF